MNMFRDVDSPRFDICQVTQRQFSELVKICSFIPFAEGFNSSGWIKYHISDTTMENHEGSNLYRIEKPFSQLYGSMPEIWCINLKRREDRMKYMKTISQDLNINFFTAIDGRELNITDEIKILFKKNDFNNRRAVMGCALSHYYLWKQLIASKHDRFLIIEDDIEIANDFKIKLQHATAQLAGKEWDMLYLGFTIYNSIRDPIKKELWNDKFPKVLPFDNVFDGSGFFGYMLSKNGAMKLLDHIDKNGIYRAIDFLPLGIPNFIRYFMLPHLIQTPYVGPQSTHKDSDIQFDTSILNY